MGDLQIQSQSQNNLHHIPYELIAFEILPRLPPKSLIRFKSVSKPWNSLISNPQFAELHLQFRRSSSSSSSQYDQCLLINNDKFQTFNYSACNNNNNNGDISSCGKDIVEEGLVQLELGTELSQLVEASFAIAEGIFIVGSIHGLVCLDFGFQLRLSDYIFIWNPSIRQLRRIPNPSIRGVKKKNLWKILDPPKFRKQEFICGFGYVSSIDDYKIVYVTEEKGNGRKRLYVFRLRADTSTWRNKKIGVFDGYCIDPSQYSGLLVDETLFWRMTKVRGMNPKLCIVGFDLVNEKVNEVEVPEWIADLEFFSLSDLGGCLCVFWNDNTRGTVEIAMLKEYGNWDSWVKLLSFGCQHFCPYNFFGFTGAGNGKYIVHIDGAYVRLVDVNQKPSTSKKILRIGMGEDMVTYVETLISPFNPIQAQG